MTNQSFFKEQSKDLSSPHLLCCYIISLQISSKDLALSNIENWSLDGIFLIRKRGLQCLTRVFVWETIYVQTVKSYSFARLLQLFISVYKFCTYTSIRIFMLCITTLNNPFMWNYWQFLCEDTWYIRPRK